MLTIEKVPEGQPAVATNKGCLSYDSTTATYLDTSGVYWSLPLSFVQDVQSLLGGTKNTLSLSAKDPVLLKKKYSVTERAQLRKEGLL